MSKDTIYIQEQSIGDALEEQLDCISSINRISDVLERYISCDGSIDKIAGLQYLLRQVSSSLDKVYETLEQSGVENFEQEKALKANIENVVKNIPKDESINYSSYLLQAIEAKLGKGTVEIMYKQIEERLEQGEWL